VDGDLALHAAVFVVVVVEVDVDGVGAGRSDGWDSGCGADGTRAEGVAAG
jgi:hypothetical protein